ncbi:MAG TPA: MlaD family protein, partial [Actinomycetota bacterium]|nr:MlaD family protein [Actinomycetota bacterium]
MNVPFRSMWDRVRNIGQGTAGIDAPRRHIINVTVFLLLAALLVVYVFASLLFVREGAGTIQVEVATAAGIARLNDVTMRGVPVGLIGGVELTPRGTAMLKVILDAGVKVPQGTKAEMTRRSAIGDVTLDLLPGTGPPMKSGDKIP